MKGRLIDFSIGWNRKQRITIEIDSDFREGFDALKGADIEISVKKWRRKRSNDANAYFHVLVTAIARHLYPSEYRVVLVQTGDDLPCAIL